MENTQIELTLKQLSEKIVILETEGKAKDREIKELKNKIEVLTNSLNGLALTNQSILSEIKNINDKFNSISNYIEELKTQPKKDLDKFKWIVLTNIIGLAFIGLSIWLKLK